MAPDGNQQICQCSGYGSVCEQYGDYEVVLTEEEYIASYSLAMDVDSWLSLAKKSYRSVC